MARRRTATAVEDELINRLMPYMDEPEERPPAEDYFEILTADGFYYVSRAEAARVAALVTRRWPLRWIRFTDIFGADVRLLRRTITAITESNPALRAHERSLRRARHAEDKRDRRPWEDDDC